MGVRRTVAGVLAAGLVLGACTDNSDDEPGGGGSGASRRDGATDTAASSLSPSATPSAQPITGECAGVLPISALEQAMGVPVIGRTQFIVGVPEPSIDRISYLNCRYGLAEPVPGQPDPVPQVEVGISAYGSPASAAERVQGTIEAYRGQGATQAPVAVGTLQGTVLIGSGEPTLVVASGNKTVAVTVVAALLPADRRDAILAGIAQRALTGAGG